MSTFTCRTSPPRRQAALQPLASIVIASKNRPASLKRLLASLRRQSHEPFEIIVVDDGSQPALSGLDPDVVLLRNEQSRGPCTARNRGLKIAGGEFVIFLDDDTELIDSNTLQRAVDLARQYPRCGALAFRQLRPDGRVHAMQPAGSDRRCYTGKFYSYGCLIRKEALDAIGGFNPVLGFYYEENEFSLRLLNAGFTLIYDPELTVIHHEDPTGRDWRRVHRLLLRNAMLTTLLHFPWWCVPACLVQHLLRYVKWGRALGGVDWKGVTWAWREIKASLPYLRLQRRPMPFRTLRQYQRLNRSHEALPNP